MAELAITESASAGGGADGRGCDSARREAADASGKERTDPQDPRFEKSVSDVLSASEKILVKGIAYIRRIVRGEIVILSMLSMSDGYMSVESIAANTVLSRPRVTQVLNSLVERGYVEKRCDAHDRRRVNARLTQAGLEACVRMRGELEELTMRYVSCLEPDELDSFVRVLQKLGALDMDLDGELAPTDFLELD